MELQEHCIILIAGACLLIITFCIIITGAIKIAKSLKKYKKEQSWEGWSKEREIQAIIVSEKEDKYWTIEILGTKDKLKLNRELWEEKVFPVIGQKITVILKYDGEIISAK